MSSCVKILKAISRSKSPVDPSPFLLALKNRISKSKGIPFEIFEQHDVPEIFEYLLAELSEDNVFISDLFDTSVKTCITCDICSQDNVREEVTPIIHLQPKKLIQSAIDNFFSEEFIPSENAPFCHYCNAKNPAVLKRQIVKCGSYLIFQLKRFKVTNNEISKDASFVTVYPQSPSFTILVDNEISLQKTLSLKAVINHFGTVNNGHYTAVTFDSISKKWIHCNDRAVLPATEEMLNVEFPYLLLYKIN